LALLTVTIGIAVSVLLVQAFSSNKADHENVIFPPGQFPIASRQVDLGVHMISGLSESELQHNTFTSYVQDRLGIRLQFSVTDSTLAGKVVETLFARGEYPAVILNGNLTTDQQVRYSAKGYLRPLNGLIEQYGERIQELFEQNPQLEEKLTAPDGQIYALPSINECYHCWYGQKLWINTAWLDKLGLTMPATTDELYEVLLAFKHGDPNGNGLPDEIPLSGATNSWHSELTGFLMSAFIYNTDTNYLYVEDGAVGMAAVQPQWRDGLAYIRKLYQAGLIDPLAFTQSIDGLIATATQADNVLGAATLGHIRMAYAQASDIRQMDYSAVPPLIGPDGYQAAGYFNQFSTAAFAITDKATEAEAAAALRLADFLLTEDASIRNEWGPEDKWWRRGKPGEVDVHGRPAKYWLDPEFAYADVKHDVWQQMGLQYRGRDMRESWAVSDELFTIAGYENRLYQETLQKYAGKEPDELVPEYVFLPLEEADEMARLRGPINDYVRSHMVQFITGAKALTDEEWEHYIRGFDQLKLTQYLEINQEAYSLDNIKNAN